MRVALLTMIEPAGTAGVPVPGALPVPQPLRAGLRLGGVSLARHQLGTMLALGCHRIVCIAQSLDPEMLALQQVAEHAGARFHVVSGPRGLLGLVTATDEVIGLADGLSAAPGIVQDLLEAGPAVLVQPIERGLEAGFERIDINHAAAGAWRLPGRLVERLADLPSDCDTFSALQRLALQSGVGQRMLPMAAQVSSGNWALVRAEAEALALEADWIKLHVGVAGPGNPSLWLAQALVRMFGASLLHAGNASTIGGASGLALLLFAAVAGWYDLAVTGFVLAALAWVVFLVAALLGRISRATLRLPAPSLPRVLVYGGLVDLVLVVLTGWALPVPAGSAGPGLFAPVMLIGLCRLLNGEGDIRWRVWLQDRGMLALVLITATGLGLGPIAVEVLAGLALLAGLVGAARRRVSAS